MANGKKSVLLYCDIIHTVEELDDADAGLLFKHYLRYINDQNPEPPNKLVKIVFEPIKQNLKRDLRKWEEKSERNRQTALAGWGKRKDANAYERIKPDAKNADKDTVTDTVTDKDIDREEQKKFRIEDCLRIALNDPRWVNANKATDREVLNFNNYLEKIGKYEYNPLDYKKYFATVKGKYPDLLKRKYTIEEYRAMAIEQDKSLQNGQPRI